MLELKDICFERDNKKILDHINLKLDNNKFYVITGPNGSGKSTLAKIIMGILTPDSGKIIFNGIDITKLSIDERANIGIGYAFQQPVCFKEITVYDLLSFATNNKINKVDASKILYKVGLNALEYIDREVNKSLSGGELKRIELATVIARNPIVSIFDEPEAGIDLWSFNNLNEVFKEIQDTNKGINLVISHQERILNIADKIILMEKGKVVKIDNKDSFLDTLFGGTNE